MRSSLTCSLFSVSHLLIFLLCFQVKAGVGTDNEIFFFFMQYFICYLYSSVFGRFLLSTQS